MWTNIKHYTSVVMGVLATLIALFLIAVFGIVVAFIGYFIIWGLIGLLILFGIAFFIWAWFDEN